jgi:hypothetical protein
MGEYERKRSRVKPILCPIHEFWSCVKFKAENPLYRYMWSGEGHWTIHGDREKETCLQQICNNLVMITLNLKAQLRSYFTESEANIILKYLHSHKLDNDLIAFSILQRKFGHRQKKQDTVHHIMQIDTIRRTILSNKSTRDWPLNSP